MAKKEKTKKAEDLKGKSPDELKSMLMDLRKEQLNMRFQKAGGQLEDTSKVRKARRTIARIKTQLNASAKGASAAPAKAKKAAKKA